MIRTGTVSWPNCETTRTVAAPLFDASPGSIGRVLNQANGVVERAARSARDRRVGLLRRGRRAVEHSGDRALDLPIAERWCELLVEHGYPITEQVAAYTRRSGGLDNAEKRADHEVVIVALKGPGPQVARCVRFRKANCPTPTRTSYPASARGRLARHVQRRRSHRCPSLLMLAGASSPGRRGGSCTVRRNQYSTFSVCGLPGVPHTFDDGQPAPGCPDCAASRRRRRP